ncbi:hypothetical protein [Pseudomonas chlororaphis]|nr:hypothetical protein [Pseudomonas chlororaphis]
MCQNPARGRRPLIVAVPFQADTRDVVQQLARSTLDEAVQRKLL